MFGCCCRKSRQNTVAQDTEEEIVPLKNEPRLDWFVNTPSYKEALHNMKITRRNDILIGDVIKSIALAFVDLLLWNPEKRTRDDMIYSTVYRTFKPAVEKHLRHLRSEFNDMGEMVLYNWLMRTGDHMIKDVVTVLENKK